ncbi:hypothetical protein [Natronosalvus halobius]|uniref:capsular polysaccharide export protein, LipB/KpsS family n=1 Tax=Natronosalvus halobius TaxID=2953746 RepID=UPI0020A036E6|nr:hypothetical protein [Natronosalvus halobius]USZ71466.1 hypothetical protein NGM15_15560 [Natronosalvus halobius]
MTIDVIYSTTPSNDWPAVAEKLYRKHGLRPRYWISHDLKDDISERFRNTTVHDSIDAIQGRFPDEYDHSSFHSLLDSEVLNRFQEYESIVLKMMDRMDAGNVTGGDFTHSDRVRHYHRQLSYWIHVVDNISPDVVIFGAAPHSIYDYLLYAICEQRDIETVIFTHTSLPDRFCVRKGIHESPTQFEKTDIDDSKLSPDLEEHVQKLRGKYSQAEPEYMQEDARRTDLSRLITYGLEIEKAINKLLKLPLLLREKPKAYIKKSGKPIEKSRVRFWEWELYRVRARYYRRRLRLQYQKYTIEPDYSTKYIYFPLHYQPERTTSPEGGQYVHQYLAVELLAGSLPDGISVYVKEHPSQFSSRLKGEQGRQSHYYEDLNTISSVELISLNSEPFELIDNAMGVATVTGTAGWEALVRGTPAITFGSAWYRDAPGCHHVKTRDQISNAVEDILRKDTITNRAIDNFVSNIESYVYHGSLNTSNEENVYTLYNATCDNCEFVEINGQKSTSSTS